MSHGAKSFSKLQAKVFQPLCLSLVFLLHCQTSAEVKLRYASAKECDRFSMDAVYYEKFKLITDNIFKDSNEFVNRVTDLVADSLMSIMADLPDKDVSDNEERRIFNQYKTLKSVFESKTRKIHKNITKSWENLIVSHFDLMYDNGKSSLPDYLNKTINMTDSYEEARKSLDSTMATFVGFIKGIVRDGLGGITMAAEGSLRKEDEERKKNGTDKEKPKKEAEVKSKEDRLLEKKLEIAEMVVRGFLGKVTLEVIRKKADLSEKGIKPEDRDSVLDDIHFDALMIRNRIRAIIQPDLTSEKGSIDLARRSIYTYWADLADGMYKERIESKKSTSAGGDMFHKKIWSNETQLMETLLELMEVYP